MENKNQFVREYIMNIIISSPPRTQIPSERELVSHLNLSRPTIQKAINDLLMEGYLYKVSRQGAFTSDRSHCTHLNHLSSFNETAQELGVLASSEILDHSIIMANEYLASKMGCAVGEKIYYFLRLRKHSDTPVILDYAYFSGFSVSNITMRDAKNSIYRYIEQIKQLSIGSSTVKIEATLPEVEIAALLKITPNEPLILMERISQLKDGRIFEYSISYSVSRYNKFQVKSTRHI